MTKAEVLNYFGSSNGEVYAKDDFDRTDMLIYWLLISLWSRADYQTFRYTEAQNSPAQVAQALDQKIVVRIPRDYQKGKIKTWILYIAQAAPSVKGNYHHFKDLTPDLWRRGDMSLNQRAFTSLSFLFEAEVENGEVTNLKGACGEQDRSTGRILPAFSNMLDASGGENDTSLESFYTENKGRFVSLKNALPQLNPPLPEIKISNALMSKIKSCRAQVKPPMLLLPSICDEPLRADKKILKVADEYQGQEHDKVIEPDTFVCQVQKRGNSVSFFLPNEGKQYWTKNENFRVAVFDGREQANLKISAPADSEKLQLFVIPMKKEENAVSEKSRHRSRSNRTTLARLCQNDVKSLPYQKIESRKQVSSDLQEQIDAKCPLSSGSQAAFHFSTRKNDLDILGFSYSTEKTQTQSYFLEATSLNFGSSIYLVNESERRLIAWTPRAYQAHRFREMVYLIGDLDGDERLDLILNLRALDPTRGYELYLSSKRHPGVLVAYSGRDRCNDDPLLCGILGNCSSALSEDVSSGLCAKFGREFQTRPVPDMGPSPNRAKTISAFYVSPSRSGGLLSLSTCNKDLYGRFHDDCLSGKKILVLNQEGEFHCGRIEGRQIGLNPEVKKAQWISTIPFIAQDWHSKPVSADALKKLPLAKSLPKDKKISTAYFVEDRVKSKHKYHIVIFEKGENDQDITHAIYGGASPVVGEGEVQIAGDLDGDGHPEYVSEIYNKGAVSYEFRSLPDGVLFDQTQCPP